MHTEILFSYNYKSYMEGGEVIGKKHDLHIAKHSNFHYILL